MEKTIDKILEECYNLHCHEGTFTLLGHTINVFTKETIYPTTEDGLTDFSAEPLFYGGHKCAFIDDTYWTGWYYPDPGYDLKECMEDVTKEIFKKSNFKCSFDVTYNKKIKFSNSEKLTEYFLSSLKEVLNLDLIKDESLNIISVDPENCKFTANCDLYNDMVYYLFADEELLITGYYSSDNIENVKYTIEHEQEIKDFFEQAFNYTLSF